MYFYWYEPSFYAGFAPRTQDPERVHVRLSRGNQVRITVVLGEAELDAYLGDLLLRRDTYRELIDAGVIELTTNRHYERFVSELEAAGMAQAAAGRALGSPEAYREKALEVLRVLNPGRVFRIRMPVEGVVAAWHEKLAGLSAEDLAARAAQVDALEALLPGRVNAYDPGEELVRELLEAAELARQGAGPADPGFRTRALALLERATAGRYRVRDGHVEAVEFTAIYPAGTVQGWVTHRGRRLPDFGVTGVWPLTARRQGRGLLGMVDYLSPNPGYGFITMLPYQHAGGTYYNAFHNAGVRSPLGGTAFLPPEWRRVPGERDAKPYQNLWIVSRGPTSHGCTRLASGHMSEMRQVVPSSSADLERLATFRDLPQCFDVFDVDGDGSPEAMGVKYYLAYRSEGHLPTEPYVSNRREAFYAWLYGDDVRYAPDGSAVLREALTCRFVGRQAQEAQVHREIPLYEPEYAPDRIQFYRVKLVSFESPQGFELNRELRKVGAGHALDRGKLLLQ